MGTATAAPMAEDTMSLAVRITGGNARNRRGVDAKHAGDLFHTRLPTKRRDLRARLLTVGALFDV